MIINKNRALWGRELHQKDFLSMRLGLGRTNLSINFAYPSEHFTVDDNKMANDLLYKTPVYPILNITDDDICLNLKIGSVVFLFFFFFLVN